MEKFSDWHFFDFFRNIKHPFPLLKDKIIYNEFDHQLAQMNNKKVSWLFPLLFVFSLFQTVAEFSSQDFWEDTLSKKFISIDLSFSIVVLLLAIPFFLYRNKAKQTERKKSIFADIFICTIFIYFALISSIEQSKLAYNPTYVATATIITILYPTYSWKLIVFFSLSLIVLKGNLFSIDYSGQKHVYNHFLVFYIPSMWLVSRMIFFSRIQSFIDRYCLNENKLNLEEIVKVRTEELSSLNKELSYKIELQQRYEDMLKAAKNKAQESDRLKTIFLANISHEIRTPMNGIIGFSELLQHIDPLSEKRDKYLNLIKEKCRDLEKIIDSIVDISRIEAGKLDVHLSSFSPNLVIKELYDFESFKISNHNKENIQLKTTLLFGDDFEIKTDKTKLKQILSNLLDNAFKFTKTGEIEFGYKKNKENEIEFFVKDTGIGIEKDKVNIIFEYFRQNEESLSRNYGGLGLGLSISANLVKLLGGKIWVESLFNEGSCFRFTVPVD